MQKSQPGVLLVGNFLSAAGGSRGVSEELALRLERQGWQVYTTSSQPGRIARLLDMVVTALRWRSHYQVGHIEVYSGPAFLWAEALSLVEKALGKPVILTLHGGNLPVFARRWPGRVRRLMSRADVVVTPSFYIQHEFAAIRGGIRYLPNAIDTETYPFRLRRQPQARLCWLRAMHSIYQPEMAVHALAALRDEFPSMTLLMIGPDKGDGSLDLVQRTAERFHVADRLQIAGQVPKSQVGAWLDRGDIFLNTTRMESFGISVMEAAACGLILVTTQVGELPYLWKQGEDALLVPSGDADAMAQSIRRVLTEPGLGEHLSKQAHLKASAYSWKTILPQWEDLLSGLVKN